MIVRSRARLTFLKYVRNIAAAVVVYEGKAGETAAVTSERVGTK